MDIAAKQKASTIEEKFENYQESGSWHPKTYIQLPYLSLEIAGMITGCGVAQMTNLKILDYSQNNTLNKKNFIPLFDKCKKNGIGGILVTLGEDHYSLQPKLLELGFEKISEYSNYRHAENGSYKQRLYILKL